LEKNCSVEMAIPLSTESKFTGKQVVKF
jgi:hypothetical protein